MNKISNLFFILSGVLFLTACSGSGADNASHDDSIMSLPQELNAVAEQLSGKLTVYDSQGKKVATKDLTFSEDENGNTVVSSTPLELKKSATYRFILIYSWDNLPIAYVDSTQATKNAESTTVSFTDEMIVYDPPVELSADESASFESDLAGNIIPDLDADDDGFSNFIEVRSGSDPNKKASVPSGPVISSFTASVSTDGNTLTITANVSDGNGVTDINLSFEGAEYLSNVLSEEISGSSSSENRDYTATLNPQHAPLGNLPLTLTATNSLGLASSKSVTVAITNNNNNVGPVIDSESLSEGDTVGGTYPLSFHAYDRDGVNEVQVTQPGGLTNTSTDSSRFIADWDTTSIADGTYQIRVTASDTKGMSSSQILNLTISNGTDITGPKITLAVSESDNPSAIIAYQNNEKVYGEIEIHASATDASGVSNLALYNPGDFGDELGSSPSISTNSYVNTLNTTLLPDGYTITFDFWAIDEKSNENLRTFSMIVGNKPTINSFTVNSLNSVLIAKDAIVTFNWSTDGADQIEIVNMTNGSTIASNLNANGSLTVSISSSGTYQLQATNETNVGDIISTKNVVVTVDDEDGDGFTSTAVLGGTDCDDTDPAINPDATDILNGVDDDCDGHVDDVDLSTANANILGTSTDDYLGYSVTTTDVDGDGYDDILLGAYFAQENGLGNSGAVYLFYGPLSGPLYASNADAIFMGESSNDNAGFSVAAAGDVDSDLYGDFLIGARYHDGSGYNDTGAAYLIYGSSTRYAGDIALADYDQPEYQSNSPGLAIAKFTGEDSYDDAGWSVSTAGDVNGDTYDDILIVAHADDTGGYNSGATYLIYGSDTRYTANKDLCYASTTCTPSIGAKFYGELTEDYMGSASSAGDVDNDGYDDFLIGVSSQGTDDSGAAYLIYGKSAKFSGDKKINIIANAKFSGLSGDQTGNSVAPAGDVNNDGIADFLIGAQYANHDSITDSGIAYLIYGLPDSGRYLTNVDLSSPINGVKFLGEETSDRAGVRVAPAGDVNGDGIDDIMIAATYADSPTTTDTGAVYLIYGNSGGFPNSTINLADANAKFFGSSTNDYVGQSIAAGLVNNDNLSDILIGAYGVNRGSTSNAGKAYLILSNY